jgi:RNA polymerase sigma factor (TIGR02999 family)
VTTLLHAWRGGDDAACQELMALLYDELRGLAGHYFRGEKPGHTLQPTALVHELYLRLFGGQPLDTTNRGHFMAVAARQLRRLLVDHARRGAAQKRGVRVELDEALWLAPGKDAGVEELSLALDKLEKVDARSAQVIELRFFGGLTEEDTAEALGVSRSTVKRDWDFARSWLLTELEG